MAMAAAEVGGGLEGGDVLQRLTTGDATAMEAVQARYGARVLRQALRITGCYADAQEVAQDVFLAVARKHASFRGRSALATWIHRITVNMALNKRRGLRHTHEVPLASLAPAADAPGAAIDALADAAALPDGEALSRQRLAALMENIGRLPEPYQGVILLQLDGLPLERMAQALALSLAAVKSRLHRARAALRRRLEDDGRLGGLVEALA